MKKLVSAVAVLAVGAGAGRASAAGLALDVHSARATGMAMAMTGHVDDATGVFYNAAGIAQGKGLDVKLGVTLLAPDFNITPVGGTTASPSVGVAPLPHVYASYGITDDLTVGLGFFIPYGLTFDYDSNFVGRTLVSDVSFRTFVFNPTVAYRWKRLRFGAGVDIARGTVELGRDLALPGGETGGINVGGGDWGVGGNAGVQVDAIRDFLTVGAFYRSSFALNFDGRADFSDINDPSLQTTLHDQRANAKFKLPDQIGVGVAVRPLKKLLIDFDLVYFGWQRFQSITIEFPDDPSLLDRQPKQWKHAFQYRLGGEYSINDHWQVRGGLVYDQSPAPRTTLSPDIPDSDRFNIAVGGSFKFCKRMQVDAGYQLIIFTGRNSTYPPLPAHYDATAHALSVTYGIKL